jgi:CBS domain-containing protein
MTVRSILAEKGSTVVTVRSDTQVREAVRRLKQANVGALVVSDDGATVAGIISERDIVRALGDHDNGLLDMPVSRLMTREVRTCRPEDRIKELMGVMTHGRFRHLPVLEEGELVGLVSIGDIVKRRVDELEHETNHLREYIVGAR